MAPIVYLLCGASSLACAILLLRRHRIARSRFLLLSAVCFTGLALSNTLLFVDLVVLPHVDLIVYRNLLSFVSTTVMTWAFIWESR